MSDKGTEAHANPNPFLCPLCGVECVGEANCYPAASQPVDINGTLTPICPISRTTRAIDMIAMLVYPLLETSGMLKNGAPNISDREAFIRNVVKPDQMEPLD